MAFRNIASNPRMASIQKEIIRPLKKYSLMELDLSVKTDLISEA
jgi:hypothetical protein